MNSSDEVILPYDLFFFVGDEWKCENLLQYQRYGLHPVLLGDVLPKPHTCVSNLEKKPRYRILLKVGFGSVSTVWLARDLREGQVYHELFEAQRLTSLLDDTFP
jgi:hypothetical protein